MGKPAVILAGGSGFLGRSFAKVLLERNYRVVILTRGQSHIQEEIEWVHWDGKNLGDWAEVIENASSVINLTGKSVNCIYTKKNKKEIVASRLDSVSV